MSENSEWKRPGDVMIMRKRKKPGVTKKKAAEDVEINAAEKKTTEVGSRKRSNPFGCSANSKRQNLEKPSVLQLTESNHPNAHAEDESRKSGALWDMLTSMETNQTQAEAVAVNPNDGIGAEKSHEIDKLDLEVNCNRIADPEPAVLTGQGHEPEESRDEPEVSLFWPPVDWSLSTKIQFISNEPFDWCSGLSSADQSIGLTTFTQCREPLVTTKGAEAGKEAKYDVQKACMLWMSPSFPWCKLFPRFVADSHIGKPCALFSSTDVQKTLLNDWAESLTSAYHMLRSGQCPYFYVCTHQFNVLWRGTGMAASTSVHALLTPTSRGLRQALTREGIEFTMPLDKRKRKSADHGPEVNDGKQLSKGEENEFDSVSEGENRVSDAVAKGNGDDADDDDDVAQTDGGAVSWLQSMGLDSSQYKSLDPSKVKIAREGYQSVDARPESCVLVEGPDTHALLNFLLNSRACMAVAGSQTGLPPTVLAPVAFTGATLRQLKVKSIKIHQDSSSRRRAQQSAGKCYGLEISGPILPHTKQRLLNLFSRTHKQFTVSLSVHTASAPFNAVISSEKAEEEEEEEQKELTNEADQLKQSSFLGKQVIRNMEYKNNVFTWTT